MKFKLFFIFFITTIKLFSFSLDFDREIDRCTFYQQSFISYHNNKIYLSAQGSFEVYNCDNSGLLTQELYKTHFYSSSFSLIKNDTLFAFNNTRNYIPLLKVYNIQNGNLIPVTDKILDYERVTIFADYNNNYLFCKPYWENIIYTYDINTLENINTIESGSVFKIKDNYLFTIYHSADGNNTALIIKDLANINNPLTLSTLPLNISYIPKEIKYNDEKLFLVYSNKLTIIDISDIYSPQIIAQTYFQNQPSYSIMSHILFYNNFLILYDQNSEIWIYDASDINNPVYSNKIEQYATYSLDFGNPFEHMLIANDKLYASISSCHLSSFDISNLPNITKIDSTNEKGNIFFIRYQQFKNKIFYTRNDINKSIIYYFDVTDPETDLHELCDIGSVYSREISENDSLFCYLRYNLDTYQTYLDFCDMENDTLRVIGSMPYDEIGQGYEYSIIGNNLISFDNINDIKIYSLDSDNFLQQTAEINTNTESFYLVSRRAGIRDNYIYISYDQGSQTRIRIYQNFEPFEQIADFSVLYPDTYKFYFLNDNLILRESQDNTKLLCHYEFPDNFEILDTFQDSLTVWGSTHSNNSLDANVLWEYTRKYNSINHLEVKFIPIIDNSHFGEPFIYNFGFGVDTIFFYPEIGKLFALGMFQLREYSYQLTGSENDFITPVADAQLINYPNPFNPQTTISFSLDNIKKHTEIEIFNLKGQKVKNLKIDNPKIGKNTVIWNGKDNNNKQVASGIYLYSLKQDGKIIQTEKMIIIK